MSTGAMENWGLITGRTSVFLLDPKRSDLRSKKRVATVQSHEVAHMWYIPSTIIKFKLKCSTQGSVTSQLWNGGIISISMKVCYVCYVSSSKLIPHWFRICYSGKQTLMDWSYVLIVDADGRSHYPWCVTSILHFCALALNNYFR